MSGITDVLHKESIIGDILKPGTEISHNLKVIWPSARLESPGQMIERDATQPKPVIVLDPPPGQLTSPVYTLLMVDPDLTKRNDDRFGQVRHWLITKAQVSGAGEVVESRATTISPYVGPAPVPAHLITGKPHPSRYTFILCQHKDDAVPSEADAESLKVRFEGEVGDLGGTHQHLIDRMRFDAQRFIDENGLEVVAATYMLVEGNLKSGLTNSTLLTGSIAAKAVGA